MNQQILPLVKHLGLVVQYIDLEKDLPETKSLKLLDLSQTVHATADVVNALTQYLRPHLHQVLQRWLA